MVSASVPPGDGSAPRPPWRNVRRASSREAVQVPQSPTDDVDAMAGSTQPVRDAGTEWQAVDQIINQLLGAEAAAPEQLSAPLALVEALEQYLLPVRQREFVLIEAKQNRKSLESRLEAARSELLRGRQELREITGMNEMLRGELEQGAKALDEALHRQGWLRWELEKTRSGAEELTPPPSLAGGTATEYLNNASVIHVAGTGGTGMAELEDIGRTPVSSEPFRSVLAGSQEHEDSRLLASAQLDVVSTAAVDSLSEHAVLAVEGVHYDRQAAHYAVLAVGGARPDYAIDFESQLGGGSVVLPPPSPPRSVAAPALVGSRGGLGDAISRQPSPPSVQNSASGNLRASLPSPGVQRLPSPVQRYYTTGNTGPTGSSDVSESLAMAEVARRRAEEAARSGGFTLSGQQGGQSLAVVAPSFGRPVPSVPTTCASPRVMLAGSTSASVRQASPVYGQAVACGQQPQWQAVSPPSSQTQLTTVMSAGIAHGQRIPVQQVNVARTYSPTPAAVAPVPMARAYSPVAEGVRFQIR